jgi:hypothetical protein
MVVTTLPCSHILFSPKQKRTPLPYIYSRILGSPSLSGDPSLWLTLPKKFLQLSIRKCIYCICNYIANEKCWLLVSTKVASSMLKLLHRNNSATGRFKSTQGLNTNRLRHQHAGHWQTPVAQYDAQLGPGEHFECHAHPLHGTCY